MGISSEVLLAAEMPANLATSNGFPFGILRQLFQHRGLDLHECLGVAVRRVWALADTSTIDARPFLS